MKNTQFPNRTAPDIQQIEFFRQGMALLPDPYDKRPGVAFFVQGNDFELTQRFCTCALSRNRTCRHLKDLAQACKALQQESGQTHFDDGFRSSIWYHLATILGEGCKETPGTVIFQTRKKGDRSVVEVVGSNGATLVHYFSDGADRTRFFERCGASTPHNKAIPNRTWVLSRLAVMTQTDNEKSMNSRGFKTRKQALEEGFWFRCAYHGYREFGEAPPQKGHYTFESAIEETAGTFTVACLASEGAPLIRLVIPRNKVKSLLSIFNDLLPHQHVPAIHPIPLKSIFKITQNTELDLEIRPQIQWLQENGEEAFYESEDLEKFTYGPLVYIKEMGIMAQLEQPGQSRKFKAPIKMALKKSQIPVFLEEYEEEIKDGAFRVDDAVEGLKILKTFDRMEIRPELLDRDWYYLSVRYGFGNQTISLAEILRTKAAGQRYIGSKSGWIDCASEAFEGLAEIAENLKPDNHKDAEERIKLSRLDLFRLQAQCRESLTVAGENETSNLLKKMLTLKPAAPLPEMAGLRSILRHYQELGVEWIHFLFQNGFGGLLCDDMGLGKTHEVMAFLVGLLEQEKTCDPFLVVCPTTVLSHWNNIIRRYAPVLNPVIYHGPQRDLGNALNHHQVLLTSYGILRQDIAAMETLNFSVAVFDEIQNLKNPQTIGYQSAKKINARMKLGLTGTPIENRITELKALMDLTLPGYLGKDADFETRYVKPIEQNGDDAKRAQLSNAILPFALRRKKESVLHDLPEKIEDTRTCALSEDQVKLYRDAISTRGKGLLETLKHDGKAVPYIHIFALLNLLKQICDHPSLVEGKIEDYQRLESGKWDLFQELLEESLENGQKIVIYSQFLGMIGIMEKHLLEKGIDFVSLTGKTRNRGEIIQRFNQDPACRVFVGSLKAGGVGIDLVAASVVIHYDRWWNAAREDQATDRVHRIGQKRGVQVFKLVTEGTLEEKIAAIILKKRNLMDTVVEETDPEVMNRFTRKELIDLLAIPHFA